MRKKITGKQTATTEPSTNKIINCVLSRSSELDAYTQAITTTALTDACISIAGGTYDPVTNTCDTTARISYLNNEIKYSPIVPFKNYYQLTKNENRG